MSAGSKLSQSGQSQGAAEVLAGNTSAKPFTDLFGTNLRQGQRVSKLASYTGRGSLEGWLRTVLAQQYIDHYRKQRRLVSLDAEIEQGTQFAATVSPAVQTDPRFTAAVDAALRS